MKKEFKFITGNRYKYVKVEINLNGEDGKEVFTASGGLWNDYKRDYDYCGQCFEELLEENILFDKKILYKICRLHKANHLNDMNSGTELQTQKVDEWLAQGNKYDYTKVCNYLKEIDCYEEDIALEGEQVKYKYGSMWLYRPIPTQDLKEIKELLAV